MLKEMGKFFVLGSWFLVLLAREVRSYFFRAGSLFFVRCCEFLRVSASLRENFGENGIATAWNPGQVILPTMGNDCTITLSENEIGQILDGLEVRADAWEKTAVYLRSDGVPEDADFVIEECSDAAEAGAIASDYRSIIEKIKTQMEEQG